MDTESPGFSNRIVEAVHRAATSRSIIKLLVTPFGLIAFFLVLKYSVLLFLWMDTFFGLPRVLRSPLNTLASAPFLAFGSLLILWSLFCFVRARGTPLPITPPSRLIVTGPYAHSRNPMLGGLIIFIFGLGVLLGSLCLTFVFTTLFTALMTAMVKRIEEPELEKRFGEHYVRYRSSVPRFLPRRSLKRRTPKTF